MDVEYLLCPNNLIHSLLLEVLKQKLRESICNLRIEICFIKRINDRELEINSIFQVLKRKHICSTNLVPYMEPEKQKPNMEMTQGAQQCSLSDTEMPVVISALSITE